MKCTITILVIISFGFTATLAAPFEMVKKFEGMPVQPGDERQVSVELGEVRNAVAYYFAYEELYKFTIIAVENLNEMTKIVEKQERSILLWRTTTIALGMGLACFSIVIIVSSFLR